MADPSPTSSPGDSTAVPDGESVTGAPRWVTVSVAIAFALGLLVAIVLLFGGNHGPARHSSSGIGGMAVLAVAAAALP